MPMSVRFHVKNKQLNDRFWHKTDIQHAFLQSTNIPMGSM